MQRDFEMTDKEFDMYCIYICKRDDVVAFKKYVKRRGYEQLIFTYLKGFGDSSLFNQACRSKATNIVNYILSDCVTDAIRESRYFRESVSLSISGGDGCYYGYLTRNTRRESN